MTVLAALAGAVMISFSAIFFGLSDVNPVTGAFFRSAYALPILFFLWWSRRSDDHRSRRTRFLAMGAGVALGLDMIAWHSSINFIGTGLATLLANTQVIFVTAVAWLLFRERPGRRTLMAIPVILVGVAMVSGVGQNDAFGIDPVRGTLLALVAALFYSMFLLGYRRSNQEEAPTAGPLLEVTFGAAVATLVVGLVTDLDFGFTWPGHAWLIGLALIAQVAGWLLIGYALPRLPAVETATIILLQPALTILWGSMIFGERPSALQIVGATIVLGGVGFVALARSRAVAVAPASTG